MKTILITGGAGYLGLNIALKLIENNCNVVIVDNLKNSYVKNVKKLLKEFPKQTKFHKGDVCNYDFVKQIFESTKIDIVLHLAAYKYIGESLKKPKLYQKNNMNSLETVLKVSKEFNISRFAFSSSAVVYGNTNCVPTSEDIAFSPLSPYAKTKCDGETMILEWNQKHSIPVTIFRFSNPVGANSKYMFADYSKKGFENLVPYIIRSALTNQKMIFRGNNHPTPDGTAVRDYIHITDLATISSHILLNSSANKEILNISSSVGSSVLEILKTTENLLGKKLNYSFEPRNPKEVSVSILSTDKLKKNYSLSTKLNLNEVIGSQIEYFKKQSNQ